MLFSLFLPSNVSICTGLTLTNITACDTHHRGVTLWYWCLVCVPVSGWRWGHQESGQTQKETWQSLSWLCLSLAMRWHENQSSCLSALTFVHNVLWLQWRYTNCSNTNNSVASPSLGMWSANFHPSLCGSLRLSEALWSKLANLIDIVLPHRPVPVDRTQS